jgi:hypothetical protein
LEDGRDDPANRGRDRGDSKTSNKNPRVQRKSRHASIEFWQGFYEFPNGQDNQSRQKINPTFIRKFDFEEFILQKLLLHNLNKNE